MAAKKRTLELESEIVRLYSLPLAEFTPERNALATRLRKEGDREASERVKALAKPPASAWAVNVLFRDQKKKMDALLAAGQRARGALQKALTHGSADALRDALQTERELRDDLRRQAIDLLTEDGREPGRAIVDRLTVNLESLALSPAAAEEAERGWLDRDLDPPGFEILAGLQLAARPERHGLRLVPTPEKAPAQAPEKPPTLDAKRRQRNETALEKDKEEKAEREHWGREEEKRKERIGRAEEKLARATEEADSLRDEADRLEHAAVEAERAAEEARRRAKGDREAADRAIARAVRAVEGLVRAEAELAALR